MVRSILGVVGGYIVIFAFVFLTFTGLYFLLGPEGAFQPDTYEVSTLWIVITFVLSIAAALLGGYVCMLISKNQKAAMVLAGLVLVLGIAMAIPALGDYSNEVQEMRKSNVTNMEAMQKAKQPALILLLNPIIGALGVFAGSKLLKQETT